jgi:hypothetical protein
MKLEEYSKPKIPIKFSRIISSYKEGKIFDYVMEDKLKKLGWTFLDAGYYSSVYSNPKKPYILKVNGKIDSAYAQYVALIKKYKNPHFPKISDLKLMEIDGFRYYIYLIEKLNSVPGKKDKIVRALENIMYAPRHSFAYYCRNNDIPEETIYLFQQQPELINACKIIGKFRDNSKNPYVSLDMHGGNIMQRNDGTLIITDPYS